ncbi:MAG: hypothetical protein CMH83_07650 [Nocardioides sp.]|nr:hypothetical protein [Nocardioides sp.]
MSDQDQEQDLGPRPEPETEPGPGNPGGVDAVPEPAMAGDVEPHDLDPDHNPAVDEALPEEMKTLEDTRTKATEGEEDDEPEKESPA